MNIKSAYERMLNGVEVKDDDGTTRTESSKDCIGCGSRKLVVRKVDMRNMAEVKAARESETEETAE